MNANVVSCLPRVRMTHPQQPESSPDSQQKAGINRISSLEWAHFSCASTNGWMERTRQDEDSLLPTAWVEGRWRGEKKKEKEKEINKREKPCLLGEKAVLLCGNGFRHSCVHTTDSTGTANQGRGDLVLWVADVQTWRGKTPLLRADSWLHNTRALEEAASEGPCRECVVSWRTARDILFVASSLVYTCRQNETMPVSPPHMHTHVTHFTLA